MTRRMVAAIGVLVAVAAAIGIAIAGFPVKEDEVEGPGGSGQDPPAVAATNPPDDPPKALVDRGRFLYSESCSSCHGQDARGIPGRAPSLRGVGERSAHFYLRTGRMPLEDPGDIPRRTQSPFSADEIRALVAYIGTFGGPPVPEVHPEKGNLAVGQRLFTEECAGCHQIVGQGGIATGTIIPDLQVSEPVDVAEAVGIGPWLMPHFDGKLTPHETDSLARYVEWTENPQDEGGWGIGHLGPIPEGMVTWLLAAALLVLVIRLIGERTTK